MKIRFFIASMCVLVFIAIIIVFGYFAFHDYHSANKALSYRNANIEMFGDVFKKTKDEYITIQKNGYINEKYPSFEEQCKLNLQSKNDFVRIYLGAFSIRKAAHEGDYKKTLDYLNQVFEIIDNWKTEGIFKYEYAFLSYPLEALVAVTSEENIRSSKYLPEIKNMARKLEQYLCEIDFSTMKTMERLKDELQENIKGLSSGDK